MRQSRCLRNLIGVAVLAAQVNGCTGLTTGMVPQPAYPKATSSARHPGSLLPDGVQVTTDPTPHRVLTYRSPRWDPETTALAGLVTAGTVATLAAVTWGADGSVVLAAWHEMSMRSGMCGQPAELHLRYLFGWNSLHLREWTGTATGPGRVCHGRGTWSFEGIVIRPEWPLSPSSTRPGGLM